MVICKMQMSLQSKILDKQIVYFSCTSTSEGLRGPLLWGGTCAGALASPSATPLGARLLLWGHSLGILGVSKVAFPRSKRHSIYKTSSRFVVTQNVGPLDDCSVAAGVGASPTQRSRRRGGTSPVNQGLPLVNLYSSRGADTETEEENGGAPQRKGWGCYGS